VPSAVAQSFLPGGLSITDPKAHSKVEWTAIDDRDGALCGGAFEEADRSGALQLDVCPALQASRGVKFGYRGLETEFGVIDLRGGMAQMATTDAVTVDRMVQNASQFAQKNTALTIGLTDRLFGDRLTIGMDMAWSQDSTTVRTADPEVSGAAFAQDRTGSGRWHRIEGKIFDTPEFRWSVTGDYSLVEDGYFANHDGQPRAAIMAPGERWSASTSLKAFDVSLATSTERYAGLYGERESNRVKAAAAGLTVILNSKRTAFRSLQNPSLMQGQSEVTSATLEFVSGDVMPEFLAENEDLAALVPELASITWSQGYSESAFDPTRRPQSSVEALVNWSGTLGDTMALYWREAKEPTGTLQAGSVSQFLDVSHTIRWGAWRIGVGGMLIDYASVASRGFEDATLSASLLLAYEVTGGTQFKFRLGHDRDQFSMIDDSFASRRSASDLTVSLDLSAYVRKQLARPEAHLTFDYRKKLDKAVETMSFSEWDFEHSAVQNDREGLLLSFGTKF
jgi:hypothetical protein